MAYVLIRDGYMSDHVVNRTCYFVRTAGEQEKLAKELSLQGLQSNELRVEFIKLNNLGDIKSLERDDRANKLII